MHTFKAIVLLILLLGIMPFFMGLTVFRTGKSPFRVWVEGIILEWALMLPCAIPFIIKEMYLDDVLKVWIPVCVVLSLIGIIKTIIKRDFPKVFSCNKKVLSKTEMIYMGIFFGLVAFQLYKAIFYSYEDGDDAYYVAVAQSASKIGEMYRISPYMGYEIPINFRYALAPFPVWVALFGRLADINTAIVAHLILPPTMIIATYTLYVAISKLLFKDAEKRYMFLSLAAVFVMFDNVSTSTQGVFLLTRSRQGKEALCNVILPYLFLMIFEIIKRECKIDFCDWIMLFATCMAAGLTSTFGNILAPITLLALAIYAIVKKKGISPLLKLFAAIVPNVVMVLLYIKL